MSVVDERRHNQIGVRLTSQADTVGDEAIKRALEDWPILREQLGGDPQLDKMGTGRLRVQEFRSVDLTARGVERERAIEWLRRRIDSYVTVFRPRIRDAVEQIKDQR